MVLGNDNGKKSINEYVMMLCIEPWKYGCV